MQAIIRYFLVFIIGLLVGLLWLKSSQNKYTSQQTDIIKNGIENVSKLVVVEENYTEYFNYKDADTYLLDLISFEKKTLLLVQARVLVSYDLRKMDITLDSIHKKIIINTIPEPTLDIVPTYKYYDFQQSMFNTFDKDDLNTIQQTSIEKLKKNLKVTKTQELAKQRLLEELKKLWQVASILGWTVEDNTQQLHLFQSEKRIKT